MITLACGEIALAGARGKGEFVSSDEVWSKILTIGEPDEATYIIGDPDEAIQLVTLTKLYNR